MVQQIAMLIVLSVLASVGFEQAPRPRPQPKAPEAPAKKALPPPAKKATLIVEADLACTLTIDGEDSGRLEAGGTRKATLDDGEHIVRCVSAEDAEVVWRKTLEVSGSRTRAAAIELKPLLEQKREKQRLADEKTREQERVAAEREREQQRIAAEREQAQAERDRLVNWTKRLEGRWVPPPSQRGGCSGNAFWAGGTSLVLAPSEPGVLTGTFSNRYECRGPAASTSWEVVLELSVNVRGSDPVATVVKERAFYDDRPMQDTRMKLETFRYVDGQLHVNVTNRSGGGFTWGSFMGTLTR